MALITPLKGKDDSDKPTTAPARTIDDGGPPTSSTKPKPATPKGSLFQQSTNNLSDQNMAGLGPEGGSPQVIGNQALAQILTGVRTLSTVLPGIVPILSDLTGRLQMIVPQMMADMTNGGMGLVPSMGMPQPQPGVGGPGPGMMPPGGGAPGMPPPMPPPGGMAPMGPPGAMPGMPPGGMPPPPMQPPMR